MNYTELQQEIQTWIGDVNYDLGIMIPGIIRDAEAQMNRRLRTLEMECRTSTDLTPDGVTEDQLGIYAVPDDWNGHRVVERRGDLLFILYYGKIPPLTDLNPTNWVLDTHPDLYRYASLAAAGVFLDKENPGLLDRVEMIYNEIMRSDTRNRYSGGPIRSRETPERHWRGFAPTQAEVEDGRLEYLPAYDFFDLEDSGADVLECLPGYFTVSENLIRIYPRPEMPVP